MLNANKARVKHRAKVSRLRAFERYAPDTDAGSARQVRATPTHSLSMHANRLHLSFTLRVAQKHSNLPAKQVSGSSVSEDLKM